MAEGAALISDIASHIGEEGRVYHGKENLKDYFEAEFLIILMIVSPMIFRDFYFPFIGLNVINFVL